MSEWRTFVNEFRAPKSDVAVLLTTFLLTVLVDLTVAIEVGMVLAAFLFMRRMAEVVNISVLTHEFHDPTDDFEQDPNAVRSEEHTSELQSRLHLVCRLLLEKKK